MKLPRIFETVEEYMNLREPTHRYASFDYCYNHFHPENKKKRDVERGCLELFAYLGSWGMFRGSGFLGQETSFKHLEPTIQYIYKCKESCWDIDIAEYNAANIRTILGIAEEIQFRINPPARMIANKNATTTLVTKILLGVFGFVPAFDSRFKKTFGGFTSLSERSLMQLNEIYHDNRAEIKTILQKGKYKTLVLRKRYTQAKIIDMYGFTKNERVTEPQ